VSNLPPRRTRAAPLALLAMASTGVASPAQATVAPDRAALQARVSAVRAALAAPKTAARANDPAAGWLVAQGNTWTNWPKWSKWSNWANK
jgi:hypothetical protein